VTALLNFKNFLSLWILATLISVGILTILTLACCSFDEGFPSEERRIFSNLVLFFFLLGAIIATVFRFY